MKKKFLKILTLMLIMALAVCIFVACGDDDTDKDDGNGVEESIDYAREVYLNTQKYPELANQGFFATVWNEETNMPEYVRVGSAEGAAVIDPAKPTIIMVHGWNAFYSDYLIGPKFEAIAGMDEDDFAANGNVYTAKLWVDRGWNFISFQWGRFAMSDNVEVENNVYKGGLRAMLGGRGDTGRPFSDYDASQYSIAQFFAAEYLRMVNALNAKGDITGEIRIAGHSMGGIVISQSYKVLDHLAAAGQLDESDLPDRTVFLDTYTGFFYVEGDEDFEISWSGEKFAGGTRGKEFLSAIQVIEDNGAAVELYVMKGGLVPVISADNSIYTVMDKAATAIMDFRFLSYGESFQHGHNGVMEVYLYSIVYDEIKVSDGSDAFFAGTPTQTVKDGKGKIILYSFSSNGTSASLKDCTVTPSDKYTAYNNPDFMQ